MIREGAVDELSGSVKRMLGGSLRAQWTHALCPSSEMYGWDRSLFPSTELRVKSTEDSVQNPLCGVGSQD